MKKIHFQKNIFEWDFQRFADFLLAGSRTDDVRQP